MPFLKVDNVAIRGISACVPPKVEENIDLPIYATKEDAEKVIATTGVERKHIVSDGITASDLCLQAAQKLIAELGWDKDSIDALCFVTQTPDYINQPDSFTIHDRLNLKEDCMCLDLFHGCPGWVMGLQTLSSTMQMGGGRGLCFLTATALQPAGISMTLRVFLCLVIVEQRQLWSSTTLPRLCISIQAPGQRMEEAL